VAALLADGLALVACWHLGYLFRMGWERWQPARPWYDDQVMAAIVALHLAALGAMGLYRMPWRHFGFVELARIVGVALAVGTLSGVAVVAAGLEAVARSVLVLHPFFGILALCIGRMAVRLLWEHAQRQVAAAQPQGLRRAVVVGAGDQARRLLETMRPESGWQVLALYDEDPATRGLRIAGVPVRGNLQALQHTDECRKADYVIVAVPAAQAPAYARAMEAAYQTGKTVVPLDPSWQEPQRPPVLA
jgi:FlaA1/EpsC-like NDP-sugar epimerase